MVNTKKRLSNYDTTIYIYLSLLRAKLIEFTVLQYFISKPFGSEYKIIDLIIQVAAILV